MIARGLLGGDVCSVDVAQDVGLAGALAGDDAREQGGGDVADRGGVVLAGVHHEPVVFGGQLWVGPAGVVGGDVEGFA